ncbi:MAG: SEC-C domain-containing protein [Nannocystis sp.]|nr:SEC-C domain-containing protein [Nannocystis sp.]MBK9752260.1 SEC-C domain-containing protein [Nannocystis sp.]
MVREDPEYHARLVRHYTMWKQITDDPQNPARANLLARAQSSQRASPKARPNEPCPCDSGRKYKKFCHDQDNAPSLSSRP